MQKNNLNIYKYIKDKTYKNLGFTIFVFLILMSFNFSSGGLSGDTKKILDVLYSYLYNDKNGFLDLLTHKEMYVHRWYLALLIGIPVSILEILNIQIDFNLKINLISFFLSYLFTFLYLLTPILIYYSLEKKHKNKNVVIFLTVTFFGTSMLQFSNWHTQENIVIIFIVMAISLLKSNTIIKKNLFFFFVFSLPLIKTYYFPISAYLIYLNYDIRLNWQKVFFIIFFCGLVSWLPYILQGYAFYLRDIHVVSSTFYDRIEEFEKVNVLMNLFNAIFSTSHGLFFNYHIFFVSMITVIISDLKKNTIPAIILIFYLIFFSLLPFWHGDGVGSRYLAPVMLLFIYNISYKLKDIQINHTIKILALIVIILNQTITEFRVSSLRSYIQKNISVEGVKEVNLNEYNFPYNDINLIPMYFQNKILIHKIINKPINYNFDSNKLEIEYIYPRTLLMTVVHMINHHEEKLKEKYLPKFIYLNGNTLIPFLFLVKIVLYLIFILFLIEIIFRDKTFRKIQNKFN